MGQSSPVPYRPLFRSSFEHVHRWAPQELIRIAAVSFSRTKKLHPKSNSCRSGGAFGVILGGTISSRNKPAFVSAQNKQAGALQGEGEPIQPHTIAAGVFTVGTRRHPVQKLVGFQAAF